MIKCTMRNSYRKRYKRYDNLPTKRIIVKEKSHD